MRSTLDELTGELTELNTLVKSIGPVNHALEGHEDTMVRQYLSIRRRFDYAAFVVALYSSFEKFVENLITEYVHLETRRLQYTELPQKLLKKHLARTAEMLSRGRIGEGRYVGLTEIDVVKNLFECLNGRQPYTLNKAAVVAHDRNLRISEIDELFAAVGVEQICTRVRRADALAEWYRDVNALPSAPRDGVPTATIEERVKDLVECRNQIAHGRGTPDELPGVEKMEEAVGFIQALARSIFAITVGQYLRDHHVGIHLEQRQGDGPYQKGTVVIIDPPAHRIFRGRPIFALGKTIGARCGRIQSLRVDGADIQEMEANASAPNGVGVGLDFKYPNGADVKLVALQGDDDMVWSPLESVTDSTPSEG
ncbi:MAG: hypothetical protein LBT62_06320 [Deltaproteobacteria bacterium]|jgi:hypothetical protein|nr:hypothetical protein [Deltaproteobacteria bacterium]